MSLAGDGICDEFYYLLWSKQPAGVRCPAIFLPDTVVYKCGQPCAWYFTSTALLRKNKCNLTSARIKEGFAKHCGAGDVVAAYVTLPNVFMEEEISLNKPLPSKDEAAGGGGASCIEYLDMEGLHHFLFRRRKDCGILQRFVEPKGPCNTVIRAIWSPKVCLVERRTNRHAIHDRRFGLYERTVTYEGPDHHSEAAPLRGTLLVSKLEHLCRDLTEHIAAVTGQRQRIERCVLNFKVHPNDRVYLLWPSSIRLAEASLLERGNTSSNSSSSSRRGDRSASSRLFPRHDLDIGPQLHVPRGMRLADAPSHCVQQPRPTPLVFCPGYSAEVPADCFYPVPYPTVAAKHATSQEHHDSQSGNSSSCSVAAPPLLRRLHPTLTGTPEDYARLRADPFFAEQSARMCEDCFLAYTDFALGR